MPPQEDKFINAKEKVAIAPNKEDRSEQNNDYLSNPAPTPLRVCCYGSSSAKTPEKYLKEAHVLGYTLARRGHTCVNGAGSFGCMAAMNDGAALGNGHIVGVIHEMFVVDGSDWVEGVGAHKVFHPSSSRGEGVDEKRDGPIREILVAGGCDLQERKKLLVEGADALVVLPGGPGTWDELWEMACARNLGLADIPIVCVNVDGYYDSFQTILKRAHDDELIKLLPHEIVHFEPTAERAVRWIEQQAAEAAARKKAGANDTSARQIRWRDDAALRSSIFSDPMGWLGWSTRSPSWVGGKLVGGGQKERRPSWSYTRLAVTFVAGIALGAVTATRISSRSSKA